MFRKHITLALLLALLATTAYADHLTVDQTAQFCFSADDFTTEAKDEGIFFTSLPGQGSVLRCGSRTLREGDALPTDALQHLVLDTAGSDAQTLSIGYFTVGDGTVSAMKELKSSLLPKKNLVPTAENGTLETYRNIPNEGILTASDPEGGMLHFTITKNPKRGDVELREDGSFLYTPHKNKVGKDSFSFTATDDAGNTSEPASVSVLIKKPTDEMQYEDLTQASDQFHAMWLKEEGLYSGSTIGGHLCFSPDAPMKRGEFLVMVMGLVDASAEDNGTHSGFADEDTVPTWMQAYITSALSNGMISGDTAEDGISFRHDSTITTAEAAVMLRNILQLPQSDAEPVFSAEDEADMPVWAQDAVSALTHAGIELTQQGSSPLTRMAAARILYQANSILQARSDQTFYWVQ